jgi:hypothetical protein
VAISDRIADDAARELLPELLFGDGTGTPLSIASDAP